MKIISFLAAQTLDIKKLKKESYLLTNKYFFTYKVIKDVENNDVGMHLLGMHAQKVTSAVEEAKKSILIMALIAFISIMSLIVYLLVLKKD